MASATVYPNLQDFPVATVLNVYLRSDWPTGTAPSRGVAPPGSAVTTGTIASDGHATFSGLADGTAYVYGKSVSGQWRYASFFTSTPTEVDVAVQDAIDAAVAPLQAAATAATDTELAAEASARSAADAAEAASRAAAVALKQDASTAATDAELATHAALSGKGGHVPTGGLPASDLSFDVATQAELDAEATARAAADATLTTAVAAKQDASTAATDTELAAEATARAAADALKQPLFVPAAVKTGDYTAAAGEFVPVDATAATRTITLPTAPADKTRVAVKAIAVGTGFNVTIARGGSDVFNKAGGSTSLTLQLANQAVILQYDSGSAIWYVQSTDVPLSGTDTRYLGAYGTLVARPSATNLPNGYTYFASDDNGGTVYQVQAAAWVKIAAGISDIAGGRELTNGYAEMTADQASIGTSRVDVTNITVSPTVGSRPVMVEAWFGAWQHSVSGDGIAVYLMEDGTDIARTDDFCSAAAKNMGAISLRVRRAPAAGAHTYKAQVQALTAGNATLLGGSPRRGFIQVREI